MHNPHNLRHVTDKESQCNMGSDVGHMTFTGKLTVREFIKEILNPEAFCLNFGKIGIGDCSFFFNNPFTVEYSNHKLRQPMEQCDLAQFLDREIESIKWCGSWGANDYGIKLKPDSEVPAT